MRAAIAWAPLLGMTVLVSLPLAAQAKNPQDSSQDTAEIDQSDQALLEREALLLQQLRQEGVSDIAANSDDRDDTLDSSAPKVVTARAVAPGQPRAADSLKADSSIQITQLNEQIAEKDKRIDALVQELGQLRNRLLLAETEVERLSAIIQERNRKQLSSGSPSMASLPAQSAAKTMVQAKPITRAPAPRAAAEPDMQIITVSADKAYLRTGPGMNNSPLMTVSRGTRLAVETRQGEWYRVISPAGTRAWVSSDVVIFGELSGTARSTRMGGYDSEAEARAFELIKNPR